MRWLNKKYYCHVPRICDISINKLIEQGVKGVMADIDNTIVAHNSPMINPTIRVWFMILREAGIKYCLATHNIDRSHIYQIRKELDCEIVLDDFLNPFQSLIHEASYKMEVQPSQMAVINDFHISLLCARRLGCICYKVKPIDLVTESRDSLILRLGRRLEHFFIPRLEFS